MPLVHTSHRKAENRIKAVQVVVEDGAVNEATGEVEHSEVLSRQEMQERLREPLWQRRSIFEGRGMIRGVQRIIALKPNVKPVCEPVF